MRYLRTLVFVLLSIAIVVIGGSVIRLPGAKRAPAPVWVPVTQQRLSHGRFDNFTVYIPHASPKGFVLLLSGSDGWNQGMNDMAEQLAERGAMVAGLDLARLDAALEADPAQCLFPDGDLENLSHFIQAYFRLPTYLSPILAGNADGGTLAYATLVQAPANTFAGAVSVGFCPSYPLHKPLCAGSGIEFNATPGKGVEFLPSKRSVPWTAVQRPSGDACDLVSVRNFVARVPGAHLVVGDAPPIGGSVPSNGGASPASDTTTRGNMPPASDTSTHGGGLRGAIPLYASAVDTLMDQHPAASAAEVPGVLSDLPIVTVPAQPGTAASDTFAILLSGDGGWAGLDKEVAGALAATGIPVIGLDSLRYFWSARTPSGLAADIDRMTRYYLTALAKQHVMLIGYSQGADVLPFAVNRLSPATRAHVTLTAIIGMSEHALFEFHMSSWISDDDSGPATLPEVDRISGIAVLCIYGEGEDDTLCPKLDPHKAIVVKLKGGHHFDGDYAALARTILATAHP